MRTPSPQELVRDALESDLISAAEVVGDGVRLEPIGRSHPVYRLSVGGVGRACLKCFEPRRGETDGSIERERIVGRIARERPALAALAPRALRWRSATRCVATELVEGVPLWALDEGGGGARTVAGAWGELVRRIVPPLAAMHLATRDLAVPGAPLPAALEPIVPWSLRLFSGDTPEELWADPLLGPFIAGIGRNASIVGGIRRARALWRPLCLIHGDLKHDNVLERADGSLAIVDWEMARVGDPAWDLAGLACRLPMIDPRATGWSEETVDGVAGLIEAYAARTPLGADGLVERMPMYVGAWLLMSIIQSISVDPASADDGMVRAALNATFAGTRALGERLRANVTASSA